MRARTRNTTGKSFLCFSSVLTS